MLGVAAFVLAYVLRFESGLIPITKGYPPFSQYVNVLPFVGVLVPFAFHVQGLYRLRRGRSRVDDFFAVFVGSILAVVFGIVATLYFQAYYVPDELKDRGAYEVSQLVWGIFLVLNVAADVCLARAGARGARAAVARRDRPQAHPDRRRGRARAAGRRQGPRAPRAGVSHRRVRGRSRRRGLPGASRPADPGHPRRSGRYRVCASGWTICTSPCPPKSTSGCCNCWTSSAAR